MRVHSPVATAVAVALAAAGFSAAFQPAEAAVVTIDNFTQATGTTSASGTTSPFVQADVYGTAITGPLFDARDRNSSVFQPLTPRQGRTASSSVGSGLGTLQVSNSGTTTPDVLLSGVFGYTTTGTANLLAATAGDFQGFKIVTGATNSLSPSLTGLLSGFVAVRNATTNTYSQYYLPGGAYWAPNTTYLIPFTSFSGDADFASITGIEVGFDQYGTNGGSNTLPGNVVYDAKAQFTLIAVPEPTQRVFVAGVGAALGAWRLRRNRSEAEVAAV